MCVSVTPGNLSSLTFQQEMIMAIQTSGSALTCIPSLRGHSRSTASLRAHHATYTLWMQLFVAFITEISICSFWLALSLLCDVGYATVDKQFSWELVYRYVTHVTEQ